MKNIFVIIQHVKICECHQLWICRLNLLEELDELRVQTAMDAATVHELRVNLQAQREGGFNPESYHKYVVVVCLVVLWLARHLNLLML